MDANHWSIDNYCVSVVCDTNLFIKMFLPAVPCIAFFGWIDIKACIFALELLEELLEELLFVVFFRGTASVDGFLKIGLDTD